MQSVPLYLFYAPNTGGGISSDCPIGYCKDRVYKSFPVYDSKEMLDAKLAAMNFGSEYLSDDRSIELESFINYSSKVRALVKLDGVGSTTYAHFIEVSRICGENQSYDVKSKVCILNENVQKPSTLACEIIYVNGAWQADARNPNCVYVDDRYSIYGNVVHLKGGDGEVEIVMNDDGTYTIRNFDGSNWRTINTDPYSSSVDGGGAAIKDITDSSSGSFIFGGNSTTNNYGSGSCGGVDQPACAIDDSGFDGKSSDLEGKFSDLNDAFNESKKFIDNYDTNDNFGFTADWFPRLWPDPVACQDLQIPLQFDRGVLKGLWNTKIEFCDRVSGIRQFIGWLVYLMTAIYLWRRLTEKK
ncbi:MAG: hypothetical protein LBJ59_10625 [Zoogloeaceae bacterium]|jgi:hypothetical protein|nr:hypothetical protein [Zoogloeaceae bacterium]